MTIRRAIVAAAWIVAGTIAPARAQTPTGTAAGFVADSSGGAVAAARITVTNRDTAESRTLETRSDGRFNVDGLRPGAYALRIEAPGFKLVVRDVEVDAGLTTTADVVLEVGDVTDSVTISGALPLIRTTQHEVTGIVGRDQIESLPLNGRNYLELAKLEPGISAIVRGTNNRSFVSALGAGLQTVPRVGVTRVNVDGGDTTFIGAIGAGIQVSQDAVQEFQLSTVNFDASAGMTSNAAVNIVTRSGGNRFHGDGFFFYRDHNLAAYPALKREPDNPDPFFERRQYGGTAGGPVAVDRAFFFASFERNTQHGVASVQPPQFPELSGVFPTPYDGNLYTVRADTRIADAQQAFVRYSRDANRSFAPGGGPGSATALPSAWGHIANIVDQIAAGVTSAPWTTIVNDARVSLFRVDSPETPATAADCVNAVACVGVAGPRVTVQSGNLMIGSARTLAFTGWRSDFSDTVTWQRRSHRIRFGAEWEHARNSGSLTDNDQLAVASPQTAQQLGIPVPSRYATADDLLKLPATSVQTGVGPGGAVYQNGFATDRNTDLVRLFAADSWHVGSSLTLNGGVAWSYEPNVWTDLSKPALLVPIVGAAGLAPTSARLRIAPAAGFAWTPTSDGRTVIRGGAGRYDDPIVGANSVDLGSERQSLGPLGTGRLTTSSTFKTTEGVSGAQALAMVPSMQAPLLAILNPANHDLSVRNIDFTKQSPSLFDSGIQPPSAVHIGLGIQRELGGGVAVSADAVWRRFSNTAITGIDYNRWNSVPARPVIPRCATDEQRADVSAVCSTGQMLFTNSSGHDQYTGVLVRAEKRLSRGTQFLVSYAYGSYTGTNGTGTAAGFNTDDWTENVGPLPTDFRHVLNVSGIVELPWQLQVAATVEAYSAPPFSAYVSAADFNGDGTMGDLLPGTTVNAFGRTLGKSDLERLVAAYNAQHAALPPLPSSYQFNDSFFTQDLRLTRTIRLGAGAARALLIVEVFNALNTSNLTGYSGDLRQPTFGQPTARSSQVFGSGGPRAFQIAARVGF